MNKLSQLQKEYDAMVKVAKSSIAHDVPLSPKFEQQLTSLMIVVRSMGGRV
jgi:hypothetical protein